MNKTSVASHREGFLPDLKKVSLKNWQAPDIPQTFNITGEQWVQKVLEPKLAPNVPPAVEKLFEVARGSMIYGWYFCALTTLASDQLLRVLELAVRKRCTKAKIPTHTTRKNGKSRDRNFADLVKDLIAAEVIPTADSKH